MIEEPGSGKGRLALIEYLRGVAALSVAWFHLTNTYPVDWVRISGSLGWLGVEVFFVISGFVIPLSIAGTYERYSIRHFPQFMTRRLFRLEPPYIVSILLALVLWQLSSMAPGFQGAPPSWTIEQCVAHLLYLVPLTDHVWIQPVYWSLAWEFVFYMTMGLLFPLFGEKSAHIPWYGLASITVILVATAILPNRVLLFIMGIAVYKAGLLERERSHVMLNVGVVALAGATIGISNIAIATVGTATAMLILVGRRSVAPRPLHVSLMMLGGMSYTLYLTHVPIGGRVVNLGRRYIDGAAAELALSLLALLCCLAFAHMFSRFIEKPSIEIARRLVSNRRAEARSR